MAIKYIDMFYYHPKNSKLHSNLLMKMTTALSIYSLSIKNMRSRYKS